MARRQVEVFVAGWGCPLCGSMVDAVLELACPNCDVTVHDLHEDEAAQKAAEYGIGRVPAVVVNGAVACQGGAPDREMLAAAGVGQRL
jgi:uncharacterized protein (UPF0212 family)